MLRSSKLFRDSILVLLVISLSLTSCHSGNDSPSDPSSEKSELLNSTQEIPKKYLKPMKHYADVTHSSIEFRAKHGGVYEVIGFIPDFEINMVGERKDFTDIAVEASANLKTIIMPNMGMAGNLQGLFDTDNHPNAYFKSAGIKNIRANKFTLSGEIKIKNILRPIALQVEFNGFGSPSVSGMPGFTVNGKFNRHDFEIGEPENLSLGESPHPLIGDTIYFKANLRMYYDGK